MALTTNNTGEPMISIGFTCAEISELILLIDDEPVDEELLKGIRRKLRNRSKRLRRKLTDSHAP